MCVRVRERERRSFWSSTLKNGLPIRWTWVGESWQMPVENCTFSTDLAHTRHRHMHGNTVITIKRIIFHLLRSLSSSARSNFSFIFLLPFISSFIPFPFPYRYLYILPVHLLARSLSPCLCITIVCFSISGRFISHGNKQSFQLKKKLSISTTQFEALIRAQPSKKKKRKRDKPAELRILLRSLKQNKKWRYEMRCDCVTFSKSSSMK